MAKQIFQLLEIGVISPCESEWAANVLLVKKKDGTIRMVDDSRALNHVTTKDRYPMENIQNILDSVFGAKMFSNMDLFLGYYNIPTTEFDNSKTAFVVPAAPGFPGGLFQFNRMCFGLTNAPATFCGLVDRIFGNIEQKFCLLYIDDFSVFSKTFDEHLHQVEEVLKRLRDAGLKVKPANYAFGKSSITFLVHKVSKHGLAPDPKKVKAIQDFPTPCNLRASRGWLGITNYFRRFIPFYAELAEPLTKLLTKDHPFVWGKSKIGLLGNKK